MIDFDLPNWAYTDDELVQGYIETLRGKSEGILVIYKLWKNGKTLNKCVVLIVSDIQRGAESINNIWKEEGITATIGMYTDTLSKSELRSVYDLIEKWNYKPKFWYIPGGDKVYLIDKVIPLIASLKG